MTLSTALRLVLALAAGVSFPYLELAWKCRRGFEASEACVWGRAFLPMSRWVEPLIIAPLVFGALTLIARWRLRSG